ncbi:efflux RND transporter periplasmic adaptor subunit [Thaumasiovibrio subtropicus]
MKKTIIAVTLLAVLGGGYWYSQQQEAESSSPAATSQRRGPQSVSVTTALVETRPLSQSLNLVGSLKARDAINIASEVTGKIERVAVGENSQVEAGELLVQLDANKARASLQEAQAYHKDERRKLREYISLVERGAVTQTQVEAQQASVDIAKARMAAAQKAYDDHALLAPFSGTVGLIDISKGQLVSNNSALMTLDDLSVMQLDLSVPEIYLSQIEIGATVVATSQAWGNTPFIGQIAAIDSRVQAESLNIRVRVRFENDDSKLKPGMLMNAALVFAPQEMPVIPVQALEYSGTKRFVYTLDEDNVATRTEITLGGRVDNSVMVEAGLVGGERIVVQGLVNIRDGVTVEDVEVAQTRPASAAQRSQ